jgi:FecR protein
MSHQSFLNKKFLCLICSSGFASLLVIFGKIELSIAQSHLQIERSRYLQVEQLQGNVSIRSQNSDRPARNGDLISNVGDEIFTGKGSTALLKIDTGIGSVSVSENTVVRINSLQVTSSNGRVTNLLIPKGKVRLQVRKFSNPSSIFNVITPGVIAGVRGTDYVVIVKDDSRSLVSTFDGAVQTEAQNVGVLVAKGFQNQTVLGEPPSQPIPIQDNAELDYQFLKLFEYNGRQVVLVGKVNFADTVSIDGVEQNVDRNGQFRAELMTNSIYRGEIRVIVESSSGKQRVYNLDVY